MFKFVLLAIPLLGYASHDDNKDSLYDENQRALETERREKMLNLNNDNCCPDDKDNR
jgi:hypothetical protein